MSAGSSTRPRSSSSASRSCSRGARCPSRRATRSGTATRCPATGSRRLLGQRQSASPSLAHERRAARGQVAGSSSGGRRRALLQDRPDDLGDDVAGAAHDHRVALAHVLAVHLVLVVQRRVGDRDAAHEHRLEHRERRHLAGAAGVDVDRAAAARCAPRAGTCRRSPSAARARGAQLARRASRSTLTTTPSIWQSTSCRSRCQRSQEALDRRRASRRARSSGAPAARPSPPHVEERPGASRTRTPVGRRRSRSTHRRSGRDAVTSGSFWRSEPGGGVARVGERPLARLAAARGSAPRTPRPAGRPRRGSRAPPAGPSAASARRHVADRAQVGGDVLARRGRRRGWPPRTSTPCS